MHILPYQICNTWRVQKQFAHQWLMPYEAGVDAIYVPGRRGKAVYMNSGRDWFILLMVMVSIVLNIPWYHGRKANVFLNNLHSGSYGAEQ